MTSAYVAKLGLTTQKTSVGAQKIDGSLIKTHDIASARFSLQNSLGRVQFFEKAFLLANTSLEVVPGMPFLALNNADFKFGAEQLILRSYTVAKILSITSWVKLINKREFAKTAIERNSKTFVVHVATLEIPIAMPIHLSRTSQVQDNLILAAL